MIRLHHRHQYIGCFLPLEDNLTGHLITALDYGLYSFSFSLGTNRNYKRTRVEEDDIYTSLGILMRYPMIVFSFLPSMYNLCGHKNVLAWNGNVAQDKHTAMVLDEIAYELDILSKLKGSSVIELGSYRDKTVGLDTSLQSLNKIQYKMGYRLVIMNSLDSHFRLGTTLQELHSVYSALEAHSKPYIYIGIHIAYLFANGMYDVRYPSEITRLFTDLDTLFPSFVITLVHLTDTKTTFGSKTYDECPIGEGEMWTDVDSMNELLIQCKQRYITVMTKQVQDVEMVRECSERIH